MSNTETSRGEPRRAVDAQTSRRMTAAELAGELHSGDARPSASVEPDAPAGAPIGISDVRAGGLHEPHGEPGANTPGAGGPVRGAKVRLGDRVFGGLARASGAFIVLVIAAVAVFLVVKAWPAIRADKVNFLTSRAWNVDGQSLSFGVVDLLWVTVVSSLIAMLIAVPVGVGIALFITHYAPRRLAAPVAAVVDLLAAIPSIVYGVWGLLVFGPKIQPVATFLQSTLGSFIPVFADKNIQVRTIFTAGVVLAIMILPIITAVARDVFERTPRANIEASLALGATRWEMIRMSVLPYGKAGVVSGAMLGLGRALGETIAVTLILAKLGGGSAFTSSIFSGGETFASKIANNASEFSNPTQTGAYIVAGLVLFVLTFAVNAAARFVVNRGVK